MRKAKWNLWGRLAAFLTVLFLTAGGCAWAATEKLDENEEIQWVMGDLSALRTAAQTYYSDNSNPNPPPVSAILNYFEPGSMPPNAAALYALKGDSRGWYVGYLATGLKNETYRLLQSNAEVLGLLGDDLSSPWRTGSRYFWTEALALSPAAGASGTTTTTTVIKKDSDLADAAALVVATAALVGIIADNDRYYYYVPGRDWYWSSGLVYRPAYYNRFFRHYYRPSPRSHFFRPSRYRWKTPRAGWLAPNWRDSYDYAHRWYNPRYRDDRRLGGPHSDQRWRGDHGWGSSSPPNAGRLRPINPNGRRTPQGIRPPNRDQRPNPVRKEYRGPVQPPHRQDNRQPPRLRRPEHPNNRQAPDFRRPENRPAPKVYRPNDGRPEVSRPQPRQNERHRPEVRRPQQPNRPNNRQAPEVRRAPNIHRLPHGNVRQPAREHRPSPNIRRPQLPRGGQRENVRFRH